MRLTKRRALTLAAIGACAGLWSGCTAKQQTEYVAGVSTQVQVPRDLKSVRFSVSVGGVRTFCRGYRVYDGKVQLPRSLGTFANNPDRAEPITYTIIGYTTELEEGSEFDDLRCGDRVGQDGKDARILRRSRQPYIKDEILFLPLPLKYSCFDKDCSQGGQDDGSKTCKAGRCVDATIDPSKLPPFSEDLVDGTGGACFSRTQCLGAATPAQVVDPATCTYAIANSKGAPQLAPGIPPEANPFKGIPNLGEGLNVEIVYDGGLNREVLDKDDQEGFLVPDPALPQTFRLAPGLCDMVKGFTDANDPEGTATPHRITAVRASGVCRSKTPFQPLCASDQLAAMGLDDKGVAPNATPPQACVSQELKPPDSLLLLVVDDTLDHVAFFREAPEVAVGLSLADPAFSRTDIGLVYAPGVPPANVCTETALNVTRKRARLARDEIVTSFKSEANRLDALDKQQPKPAAPAFSLDGALKLAYTEAVKGTYYRRAVLVIGNRQFGGAGVCSATTSVQLAQQGKTSGVDTYAFLLAQAPSGVDGNVVFAEASQIAAAGGTVAAKEGRGTGNKANAQREFQSVVNSLATCVYDVTDPPKAGAPPVPVAGDVLSYMDPITGTSANIAFDAGCNSDNDAVVAAGAKGKWGFAPPNTAGVPAGKKRIYICSQACDAYRNVLFNSSAVAAAFQQPAPAVPVFSHKKDCEPTPPK